MGKKWEGEEKKEEKGPLQAPTGLQGTPRKSKIIGIVNVLLRFNLLVRDKSLMPTPAPVF